MKKFFAVILICMVVAAARAAVITPHWSRVIIDNLVVSQVLTAPDSSFVTPGMFIKRTGVSGTTLGLWDNCSVNEIPKWNGTAWACTADAVNTGSNPVFDNVQSGTNTSAVLTVGSGATLTYSGTGVTNANQYKGTATPSGAEFGYLSGVSSAIQTQLGTKENTANKGTDNALGTSDTIYPSQKAVKEYVDNAVIIVDNTIALGKIAASGTRDNTTFLRGDGAWAKVVGRGALVYMGAAQATDNNTFTAIEFTNESYDTDSIHSVATDNTKLIVPTGVTKVKLLAQLVYDVNATGIRGGRIYKNGALYYGAPSTYVIPDSTFQAIIYLESPVLTVSATDYFSVFAYQTSGSPLNVVNGYHSWFAMEIIQ